MLGRGYGIRALMRYIGFLERISSIRVRSVHLGKCDIVIDEELHKDDKR